MRRVDDSSPAARGRRLVERRVGYHRALVALIAAMFAVEATMHLAGGAWTGWLLLPTALLATVLALGSGLTLRDLGLSAETLGRGLRYSAVIVVAVAAVIAAGLAVPALRNLFRNTAYPGVSGALLAALVLIPWQTVIPEELLFRGVLTGALLRRYRVPAAIATQALLFELWHVISSTGLSAGNAGVGELVGTGPGGTALGVVAAVVFTSLAGLVFGWLRIRTGSLLPCIALHWTANGAGAIASAAAWHLG